MCRFLTWGDKILIVVLIVINSYFLFWLRADGIRKKVIIEVDDKVVGLYDLDVEKIVTIEGVLGPAVVEIKDGKVKMLSSSCPHKQCVEMGRIEKKGEIICCVPNKVLIRIMGEEGRSSPQLDGIAY